MSKTESAVPVAIVEDDARFRNFVRTVVEGTPGFRCCGAYSDADMALELIGTQPADLLLLDLELPGTPGELAIAEFRRRVPRLEVIALTFHQDPHRLFTSLESGAVGYLVKPITPTELATALYQFRDGGAPMSGSIARLVLQSFHRRGNERKEVESLTARELEVLRSIAGGALPEDVATELGITVRTVQTHLRNIYHKLHVHSRSQAVGKYLNLEGGRPGGPWLRKPDSR